jgi:hypothetical protein
LRQKHPDFREWPVQRIGREVDADQVLHVVIDKLQLQESEDSPLLQPLCELRLKVIGVSQPPTAARLWPNKDESDGYPVTCTRQAREMSGVNGLDTESTKLARDTAVFAAMPFHDVDLEETPERER